jgi:hypothetical protein
MPPDVPRKPLRAAISGTPGERRLNRLKPPPCPTCHRDDSRVTLRTDYVLYFHATTACACGASPSPGTSDTARSHSLTESFRSRTRARRAAPARRAWPPRCATRSAGQPIAGAALGRCSSDYGGTATACGTCLPRAALRTSRRSPAMRSSPLARHDSGDAVALGRHHARPLRLAHRPRVRNRASEFGEAALVQAGPFKPEPPR